MVHKIFWGDINLRLWYTLAQHRIFSFVTYFKTVCIDYWLFSKLLLLILRNSFISGWCLNFFWKNKEKEIAKISHNITEITIWQIHSNFALGGSPCLDTAGKDSSVIGDPGSFFKRTFSLPFYPYIEKQKIGKKLSYSTIFIKWIFFLPLFLHF